MVIFNSYVSSPEGIQTTKRSPVAASAEQIHSRPGSQPLRSWERTAGHQSDFLPKSWDQFWQKKKRCMFIQSFLRTWETIFPNWLGIGREIGIVAHTCKWKMGAEVCVDMEELNSVGVQKNQ